MKSLIKFHFTVIFLHLLVTSCIFFTKHDNINRAKIKRNSADYQSAVIYINAYLIVSIIMLGLQLIFASIGLIFAKGLFSFQIVFQLLGLFSYSCFILMKMNYISIAYMWGVFCLIPFLLDVLMIIFSMVRNKKYESVDA